MINIKPGRFKVIRLNEMLIQGKIDKKLYLQALISLIKANKKETNNNVSAKAGGGESP